MEKENKNNKGIIIALIVVMFILLCVIGYLLFGKGLLNKKTNHIEDNSKYLSLKDFPLKDDTNEENNYIKFKNLLSFMNSANLNINNKMLTASFDNYNFSLESINTVCITEDDGAYLEGNEYSLKINDVLIYNSSRNYPYILITDKYLIIRSEDIEHYKDSGYEDNLEKSGNIYIFDKNLKKVLEINNTNTFNMTRKYNRLNGALDFALKNNVLYYVIGNGDSRVLKYVDLNENNIVEKTIENFNYNDSISRNRIVTSINQFPYEHSFFANQSINGYDVTIDNSNDIMTITKSNKILKEINYVAWYNNTNRTGITGLLGGGSAIYKYENIVYYLVDNKDDTLSLKSIEFDRELKEETIETFKKYKMNDTARDTMFLGECDPQRN